MEFDSLIIADWPRALSLAKELSTQGERIAYFEISPYLKRPFPLFLSNSEEKTFLESLGFLSPLTEGFCFLSEEGVFLMKEQLETLKSYPKLLNNSFIKKPLVSYLEQNLAGRVFEFNDSRLSKDKLDLLSSGFLFEPDFRKKKEFQKKHPEISFFNIDWDDISSSDSVSGYDSSSYSSREVPSLDLLMGKIKKHSHVFAKKSFCLSDRVMSFIHKPSFQWKAFVFKADLGGYESVIPDHFIAIKRTLFPWCYDNLLSVFLKKGNLELWMRLPPEKEIRESLKEAQTHLESLFPGANFEITNPEPLKSFCVYGEEFLKTRTKSLVKPWTKYRLKSSSVFYMQNLGSFFQASLDQDIKTEIEFSQSLGSKL